MDLFSGHPQFSDPSVIVGTMRHHSLTKTRLSSRTGDKNQLQHVRYRFFLVWPREKQGYESFTRPVEMMTASDIAESLAKRRENNI
jgi:hypothetical protein